LRSVRLFSGRIHVNDWSIDLCLLSICRTNCFSLQYIATCHLMNLFSSYTRAEQTRVSTAYQHITILFNQSEYFSYLIACLWYYSRRHYTRHEQINASQLLLTIHSILPDDRCDELICQHLFAVDRAQRNIDATLLDEYQHFFTFWHFIRHSSSIPCQYRVKTFSHCLFALLTLAQQTTSYSLKSIVQQWLCRQCLLHGRYSLNIDSNTKSSWSS
jgi:hypothetical protein